MPDDPPAFRLHEGAGESTVLLHIPHSGTRIPPAVRRELVLDDAALTRELALLTDAHTARIAELASAQASSTPWRFANELSRLVVDPERFPDGREEMSSAGMGAVYTRTAYQEPLREPGHDPAHLLRTYYEPYAAAMTAAVQQRLDETGRCIVVDVHSYPSQALPYELHGKGPRPRICLGTDTFHTPRSLEDAAREAFAEFGDIGLNSPFAGAYVPLRHYGREPRVQALMVEIRRDVYMSEPGGPAGPGLDDLARALAELVDRVARVD